MTPAVQPWVAAGIDTTSSAGKSPAIFPTRVSLANATRTSARLSAADRWLREVYHQGVPQMARLWDDPERRGGFH